MTTTTYTTRRFGFEAEWHAWAKSVDANETVASWAGTYDVFAGMEALEFDDDHCTGNEDLLGPLAVLSAAGDGDAMLTLLFLSRLLMNRIVVELAQNNVRLSDSRRADKARAELPSRCIELVALVWDLEARQGRIAKDLYWELRRSMKGHSRKRSHESILVGDFPDDVSLGWMQDPRCFESETENEALYWVTLGRSLEGLSPCKAALLYEVAVWDHTNGDAAEMVGMLPGSAKRSLTRARAELRHTIPEDFVAAY